MVSLSNLFERNFVSRITETNSSQMTVFANIYYYLRSKTKEMSGNDFLRWYYVSFSHSQDAKEYIKTCGDFSCVLINLGVSEEEWTRFSDGGVEGFTRLPAVENYIASAGEKGLVLVNPAGKRTAIILQNSSANLSFLANLAAAMPVYLTPWAYPEGLPASKEIIELASLISQRKWAEVFNILRANYEAHISEELMEDAKRVFGNKHENTIKQIEREISNCRNQIQRYEESMSEQYRKLYALSVRKDGLLANSECSSEIEELTDYMRRSGISILSVDGSRITLRLSGYLNNFNEEIAKAVVANTRSSLYSRLSDKSRWKRLFSEIFIEGKYKIRCFADVKIAFDCGDGSSWIRRSGSSVSSSIAVKDNRIWNPHIGGYDCFGQSVSEMNNLLMTGDYIGLFIQLKAQISNMNFEDTTVMECLSNWLDKNSGECFLEKSDKSLCSAEEVMNSYESTD